MFLIRGSAADLRRGWSRRDCLRIGLGGALGLLSSGIPGAKGKAPVVAAPSPARGFGQAKACILIYLFGGPSHLDIWDLKPNAPDGIRGEFKPIATNVPGIQITEHLPMLARLADRYAILRSLTHGDSAHGSAGHTMLTGRSPRVRGEVPPSADDFPHYGSVLAHLRPRSGNLRPPLANASLAVPPFVSLPWAISTSTNIVPGQNASFLGRALDPFRVEPVGLDESNGGFIASTRLGFAPPLTTLPEGVTPERLQQRRQLHARLEPQSLLERNPIADDMGKLYQRAFEFIESPAAQEAFRLEREPPKVRDRYGMNVFGQSLLLARRLVEVGVRLVTVYWPDRKEPEAFINNGVRDSVAVPAWDTHGWKVGRTPNFPSLRDKLLPALDLASTALLEDLQVRGLLEQTLVVWTGEFGRTPKINTDAGRDHYGEVFSAMLAGGGIRGGMVYGASDKHGAFPLDNPISPAAFAATLYHCLGIAPDTEIPDRLGRPVKLSEGRPLWELLR